MLEPLFLKIVFTIATNFFYLLMFPTLVMLPIFFAWVLPSRMRWSLLVVCLPLAVAYGYLAFTKLEPVLSWIHRTGESGEIVFSDYYESGNVINNEPEMMFAGMMKTQGGNLIPFKISAGGILRFPPDASLALQTHKTYPVKYRPSYPGFWLIDRGSIDQVYHRQICQGLWSRQNELQAVNLLKPEDHQIKRELARVQAELAEKKCEP